MTERRFFYLTITVLIVILLMMTKVVYSSANDLSRFFTMSALVERQTFTIEIPANRHYPDTIYLTDRGWYSDKPPLLSIIGAGLFITLRSFGILHDPVLASHANVPYYILTLIMSGAVFLFFVFMWRLAIRTLHLSRVETYLWLLMGAAGTLLLPFATVFSNHVITACIAFITFYFLITQNITKKSIVIIGALTGILPAIDVPFGTLWLIIITALLWPQIKKYFWYYSIAVLPGIGITLVLNWLTTGSIVPMYLVAKHYLSLPENNWRTDLTSQSPSDILMNVGRALFGRDKGIFIYSPILALGFWALLRNTRSVLNQLQRLILLGGSIVYIIGVIALTNDLGGGSYGLRWALPLAPMWLWAAAEFWPLMSVKKRYIWAIIGLFSITMAIGGLLDPWDSGENLTLWHLLTRL